MSLAAISEQLEQNGIFAWPNFLSEKSLRETRADFDQIQASGGFMRAKTGKGAFYRRHLDRFHKDDSRLVSFVLYLNQDWKAADGGRLRIYQEDSHTDIDPVRGTMVCFMSRESEHEVMESFASRYSFTGWFKVDPAVESFANEK